MRLGPGDAFVHQPGVQLVIALDPQARREEALANEADLVLDLALLPARRRRAGDRLDKMMRAHLKEAAIVLAILADEDRLHRRLHVVVDAARAGAPEERERPLVGVENHLLRLARIGAHEHHAAVAKADVRDLHRRRHAVHHNDLVAPVELVGLARRKRQRHIGAPPSRPRASCRQADCIAPDRVVAARRSQAPRSSSKIRISVRPLARRLAVVLHKQMPQADRAMAQSAAEAGRRARNGTPSPATG